MIKSRGDSERGSRSFVRTRDLVHAATSWRSSWVCFGSPKYQLEMETSPFMLIPASLKLSPSSHCSLLSLGPSLLLRFFSLSFFRPSNTLAIPIRRLGLRDNCKAETCQTTFQILCQLCIMLRQNHSGNRRQSTERFVFLKANERRRLFSEFSLTSKDNSQVSKLRIPFVSKSSDVSQSAFKLGRLDSREYIPNSGIIIFIEFNRNSNRKRNRNSEG